MRLPVPQGPLCLVLHCRGAGIVQGFDNAKDPPGSCLEDLSR